MRWQCDGDDAFALSIEHKATIFSDARGLEMVSVLCLAGRDAHPLTLQHRDGEIRNFQHDASWEFQLPPPGAVGELENYQFWNSAGNNASGCKTEHLSPVREKGAMRGFVLWTTLTQACKM